MLKISSPVATCFGTTNPIVTIYYHTTSDKFLLRREKIIHKKLIFDDNLDFEKFSSASTFVAFVRH